MKRMFALLTVLPALLPASSRGDDVSALSLADLAAYRAALTDDRNARAHSVVPVTFRELWDHPETYRGRVVQVEGRVVRRFRQGPIGNFPALEEAWAVSPSGDPFCIVFPASTQGSVLAPNSVRFRGVFLRRIRYQGGDVPRLAPLIVGSRPPEPSARMAGPDRMPAERRSWLDGTVGVGVALVVAMVLAWQYARRPPRRLVERHFEKPPVFETTERPAPDAQGDGRSSDGADDVRNGRIA